MAFWDTRLVVDAPASTPAFLPELFLSFEGLLQG